MSQPLKPGENEIILRVVLNDRDYDDLEAFAKIIDKSVEEMIGEMLPMQNAITGCLETYRETRAIGMELAASGLRGDDLTNAIKRRLTERRR